MLDIGKRNGSMPDLKSVTVAVVGGREISLHDALYTLKLKGQLAAIVAQAVTDQLIADAADREGITVAAAEVQQAADRFRMSRGLNRVDATEGWLAHNRLSRNDLEAGLKRALFFEKMMAAKIAAPERLQQYFLQERRRFDRARLSRIMVATEDLARELLAQLVEDNKDFDEVARRYSTDLPSKLKGGSIGVVQRIELPPAIEMAVFNAKPNDVVGPIRVGNDFQLVKVEAILPGQLTPEVAALLRRELFRRWLRQEAEASVHIKLQELV